MSVASHRDAENGGGDGDGGDSCSQPKAGREGRREGDEALCASHLSWRLGILHHPTTTTNLS